MSSKVHRTFFPIIILGDGKVGKTSLLLKTVNNEFRETLLSTIGIDYMEKRIIIENQKIKLKIYDTAGQERFKSIALKTMRNSEGVLLVYGINDLESFQNLEQWIDNIKNVININKKPLVLIGNKCDLKEEERKISPEKGQELAEKYGLKFFECSAKTGQNVNEAFDYIAKEMYNLHKQEFSKEGNIKKEEGVENDNENNKEGQKGFELKEDNNKEKNMKKKNRCC